MTTNKMLKGKGIMPHRCPICGKCEVDWIDDRYMPDGIYAEFGCPECEAMFEVFYPVKGWRQVNSDYERI